ncbi:MAG: hypothetical protein RLZ28_449 [Actinomycetota bacterium]|jgi:succinyl-diaminopimelate desuccinylase
MPVLNLHSSAADLTEALCNIESVSGNEAAIADAIEVALRDLKHLDVLRDGNAIVARTNLARARRVVIAGHIDTVPVAGNLPIERRVDAATGEPMLWGRGTVDMKAGVAVQLRLAATISEPNVDVTYIFYDNEEVDASLNGLGRISRNHPEWLAADFAILGEPTSAQIEGGCNGTMRVEVITRGVKAHSARPWMGSNAIHSAAPALATLAAHEPVELEVDGLVYRESLNAVLIAGGIATNVIADECVITVNYRFAPSRDAAAAESYLREVFAGTPNIAEIRVVDLAEGARPGLDLPEAASFVAATGLSARPKYGWTDVARFSSLGVPAVNFGPGNPSLAHADNEAVAIAEIFACEEALTKWLTA